VIKTALGILFILMFAGIQTLRGQSGDSLYWHTKAETLSGLAASESGPDYRLCWHPLRGQKAKQFAYLIFIRPDGQSDWAYFHYVRDTCFVHYGAALFYPEIAYEVHAYYGSVRVLPGYPRDPQDPRLPGEAIRSSWEPPFFDPQRK